MKIVWRILLDGSVTVGSDPTTKCSGLSHLSFCKKDVQRKSLNMPSSLWKKRVPTTRLLLRPWLSEHQREQNHLFLYLVEGKDEILSLYLHTVFFFISIDMANLFHHSQLEIIYLRVQFLKNHHLYSLCLIQSSQESLE